MKSAILGFLLVARQIWSMIAAEWMAMQVFFFVLGQLNISNQGLKYCGGRKHQKFKKYTNGTL